MTAESESGQSFHRSTFGGQRGDIGNGQTETQREGRQDGHEERRGGVGTVVEIKGPVVDVRFSPEEIPEIYNALTVQIETGEGSEKEQRELVLEVQQLLGDDVART